MKIDHIALYTNNLSQMKHFYETYFGAVSGNKYHNPQTGLETYFLRFQDGARLEIMTRPKLTSAADKYDKLGYAHLSFLTSSRDHVDLLTKTLKDDGYTIISGPRVTGDGFYESCVSDPDGNQIEITG